MLSLKHLPLPSTRLQRGVSPRMAAVEAPRSVSARATLFEKLGGKDAVNAAVDVFYAKMLADDRVSDYFKNTDMRKQKAHQVAFMTYAFGGPNGYKGRDMTAAHAHLRPKLEEKHFNVVVEHFIATLQELGVAQEEIDAACAVVAGAKDAVLAG